MAEIGFVSNKLSLPILIIELLFSKTSERWKINPKVAVQIVKFSIFFLLNSEKIISNILEPSLSIIKVLLRKSFPYL